MKFYVDIVAGGDCPECFRQTYCLNRGWGSRRSGAPTLKALGVLRQWLSRLKRDAYLKYYFKDEG